MGEDRTSALQAWAAARGYCVAYGGTGVLADIRREFAERHDSGQFDSRFHGRRLAHFDYGGSFQQARAVIVVAVPRPAHRVTFELDTGPFIAVLPPTYVDDYRTRARIRDELASTVLSGCRVELLNAPLKAVAARLGLVRYGLNNISYVSGLGSYFQPVGCLTDADLSSPEATLSEPAVMPECQDCGICRSICPTGAIEEDRFLLHQERCLTFLNEERDDWPAALGPSIHNCLVGCLICQDSCPENAGLLRMEDAIVSFTRTETAALLAEDLKAPVWDTIRAKLDLLDLRDYESVLPRNLRALLAHTS